MIDLHAIKAAYPIIDIVAAYAARPRRIGRWWLWRCPFHPDRTPSFSIIPDSGRFVCFGCGAKGDVIDFVMRAEGIDFMGALAFLQAGRVATSKRVTSWTPQRLTDANRTAWAIGIWGQARPAEDTAVETYLRSRGLTLPIPASLRCHASLKHTPSRRIFPAMVAAVQAPDRSLIGIHRTFLLPDGGRANVDNPKMMLGHCCGGAVRLALAEDRLLVAEGIESALSAMALMDIPAWAALSTSGLRALVLPQHFRDIVIAADGDEAGEAAADAAAKRWTLEGRRVRILLPPNGSDFNDLILGQVSHRKENAA